MKKVNLHFTFINTKFTYRYIFFISLFTILGGSIKADILKMGTIFNWEKEYFTMDDVSFINRNDTTILKDTVIRSSFFLSFQNRGSHLL